MRRTFFLPVWFQIQKLDPTLGLQTKNQREIFSKGSQKASLAYCKGEMWVGGKE